MNEHSYMICPTAQQVCVEADRILTLEGAIVAIMPDAKGYVLFYRMIKS